MINPANDALFSSDLWESALEKFASAAHLTVSLFGLDERMVLGPVHPTPLFQLFNEQEYDPGIFIECARRCLAQSQNDARPVIMVPQVYGLAVVGASLMLEGKIVGAAVGGYVFTDFSQVSEIQILARQAGIPFTRLWEVARTQKPVPQSRLMEHGELLQVLGDALLRENYRTRQYAETAAIVDSSDDAIISMDLDGGITSWNLGAERIFGYSTQEAIGQPITIIVPADWLDKESGIRECIRRGKPIKHYETMRQRKDGSLLDMSLTVSPICDPRGQIVGASAIARDTTERKRTEALMYAQKQAFEMAASGAPLIEVLEFFARTTESQAQQPTMVAIHLLDETGMRFQQTAAPSLPAAYVEATNGMEVSSATGPCCVAVTSRQRVAVADVVASKEFPGFASFAAPLGIRACWSTPILSSTGKVLGTFAHYYREVRAPHPQDDRLAEILTRTAAVIVERKQTDEALRESEDRFRMLADNMSQLAWTCDLLGNVTWYNQRWLDYTGMTYKEMQGWNWSKVQHPDHLDRVVQHVERSRDTGETWEDTFPLRGKDGSYRWFLSRAIPIRDASGKVVRWFGTNTDITEVRNAQEALRKSEKLAAMGRLAATMAHEINNPLESVTNLLYLARKENNLSPQVRQHLQLAEQELDRVAHVAKQTLGLYRDHSVPIWLDASQIIEDLLEVYSYRLRNRDIPLEKELGTSIRVFASAGEFRQVFSNLLINAVDAIPAEGGRIRVRIRRRQSWSGGGPSGVRISVADSGSGIDPKDMPKIFDAFYTTKEEIGTGVGLWLSRTLVEKYGGQIRVRSRVQPGRSGTVFSVFWPDRSGTEALAS